MALCLHPIFAHLDQLQIMSQQAIHKRHLKLQSASRFCQVAREWTFLKATNGTNCLLRELCFSPVFSNSGEPTDRVWGGRRWSELGWRLCSDSDSSSLGPSKASNQRIDVTVDPKATEICNKWQSDKLDYPQPSSFCYKWQINPIKPQKKAKRTRKGAWRCGGPRSRHGLLGLRFCRGHFSVIFKALKYSWRTIRCLWPPFIIWDLLTFGLRPE